MEQDKIPFWSISAAELLKQLQITPGGLTENEAQKRLKLYGANLLKPKKRSNSLTLFFSQFKSPIILILLLAAVLSFFLHDPTDTFIILSIVFISGFLGFWQERGAINAVDKLLAIVKISATVIRDGIQIEIPIEKVVSGDVIIFNAGDSIPGDCLILESKELYINEATLTGETFPVEKKDGVLEAETPLAKRTNTLFMGTHVVSGNGKAVVVKTGLETEFGRVSERLKLRLPETEFEHGVRRFGYFLMEVTFILVIAIFAINVYLARPVLDSFLFSLALAVGLTPQLLPAIISVNLAHGAKRMAAEKVIVKRLASIENFGSMNVLCSDKTGTLTEGVVHLHSAIDIDGNESEKVLFHGYINSFYETGFTNPIDNAIRTYKKFDLSSYQKLDEMPYDFIRKRLSVLVSAGDRQGDRHLIITKGTLQSVVDICSSAETSDGKIENIASVQDKIQKRFEELSREGLRILGVAYRDAGSILSITREDEIEMTFLGFLVFYDPPKPGMIDTIKQLKSLGVSLKVITGDNRFVARYICQQLSGLNLQVLTGPDMRRMSDEALIKEVNDVDIFAEVEPNQKERIILAFRKAGHVVGFMGDGINDSPALHAADVSISVDSAVDVAKEAADIVLLEKDLGVLVQGVREGRMTFANTLKYVFMATSANFGNMFSMAGASLFLPFLPLLPTQILLTNLMTDFPEMTIATDSVDSELIVKPRRWDISFIRNFMITFGILSSVFDYLTFGVLLFILKATPELFRTGWFVESVISASMIVLIIRTRKPFFKSIPGKYLLIATLLIACVTLLFPLIPPGKIFEFKPLPVSFLVLLGIIVAFYIISAEVVKKAFYNKVKF